MARCTESVIAYTGGLWPGLVRFLADPMIPLDTNSVERALRDVAVGRKNHYGSCRRGAAVSFLETIDSARAFLERNLAR